jgi:type I restriction enzyme S subunit
LVPAASKTVNVKVKKEPAPVSTQSHNWQFNEAVIISVLVKNFGTSERPLGRKRRTKFMYLLHRHVEHKAQGYLKKAAGPYNPLIRYGGPESIAQKRGYVRAHHYGKYEGFVAADNIAEAEAYFENWRGAEALVWLERFRYETNDELELLSTVDMAMEDIRRVGKPVASGTVKQVIKEHPEWEAKLERPIFSDANITRAIQTCRTLFAPFQGEE